MSKRIQEWPESLEEAGGTSTLAGVPAVLSGVMASRAAQEKIRNYANGLYCVVCELSIEDYDPSPFKLVPGKFSRPEYPSRGGKR